MNATPGMVVGEIAVTTLIYLIVIYYASCRYEWSGMLAVIVVASIVTAYLNRFLLLVTPMGKTRNGEMIVVALGMIALYLLSSIGVFIILAYRFNMITAIALSVVSGFILYLFKRFRA